MNDISSERPSVVEAIRAIDADDLMFIRQQRSIAMTMIFRRRQRAGGLPDNADVGDYEALVSTIEATS